MILHEPPSSGVQQDAALSAHRLGNQKRFHLRVEETGRVELDEFHVRDRGAGTPGHGDAVAGRDIRVRRVEVNFPASPGGEDVDIAAQCLDLAGRLVQHIDTDATILHRIAELAGGDEVHGHMVFHDLDARMLGNLSQQCLLDGHAGGVLKMEDPAFRVPTLLAEVELVVAVRLAPVKMHPEPDEFGDPFWPAGDNRPDGILVAEPCPCGQGILDMEIERILPAGDAGDTALRPCGVRVRPAPFGDQGDTAFFGGFQGETQPGNAAANDDEIKFFHGRTGSATLSMRRAFPRKTAAARRPGDFRFFSGRRDAASTASM